MTTPSPAVQQALRITTTAGQTILHGNLQRDLAAAGNDPAKLAQLDRYAEFVTHKLVSAGWAA